MERATNEQNRLNEAREAGIPWKKWGPYLSEAHSVSYLPAESNTGMFGGNSNWRGPI